MKGLSVSIILILSTLSILSIRRALAQRGNNNFYLLFSVLEDSPANVVLGDVIRESDATLDYDSSQARLLRGNYDVYFAMDGGLLKTSNTPIDREIECASLPSCSLELNVLIITPARQFVVKVFVEVLDINDNAPKFQHRHMDLYLSENAARGNALSLPAATDADSPANGVKYYRLQCDRSDVFGLRLDTEINGNQPTEIGLILLQKVDYETQNVYELNITASDTGGAYDVMTIRILVQDENDNRPQFRGKNYAVTVREDALPATTIAQVAAYDIDEGQNGQLVFSFSPATIASYGHLFGIDGDTGKVFIKSALDYEVATSYALVIVASNLGSVPLTSQTKFTVYLLDVNDNKPLISVTDTADGGAEIMENSPVGTVVAVISVNDLDSGDAGRVSCETDDSYNVQLRETAFTNLWRLTSRRMFDREKEESFQVSITCLDHGTPPLYARTNLTVFIKDENDNTPIFENANYYAKISENNEIGTSLIKVSATDVDLALNGQITYHVDYVMSAFIDVSADGVITAIASFDREESERVSFYVIASDKGQPSLSSSALVTLLIDNIDDEPPMFSNPSYEFKVPENEDRGILVGQVSARDRDSSEKNQISYSLAEKNDAFTIDGRSGQIFTTKRLDREQSSTYQLRVIAREHDVAHLSTTIANVTITVIDKNDNKPVLVAPENATRIINLSSASPLGHVLVQIVAHDADAASNGRLTYTMTDGNVDNLFEINVLNGNIFVKKSLTSFAGRIYRLAVSVTDNGEPQLSTVTSLYVYINDSATFKEEGETFLHVVENSKNDAKTVHPDWFLVLVVILSAFLVVVVILVVGLVVWLKICRKSNKGLTHNQSNLGKNVKSGRYSVRKNEEKVLNERGSKVSRSLSASLLPDVTKTTTETVKSPNSRRHLLASSDCGKEHYTMPTLLSRGGVIGCNCQYASLRLSPSDDQAGEQSITADDFRSLKWPPSTAADALIGHETENCHNIRQISTFCSTPRLNSKDLETNTRHVCLYSNEQEVFC